MTMSQKEFSKVPIIVMGVSGCGKSLVASSLALKLNRPFIEGDSLHPRSNIDKMSSGIPLDDDDRYGWLELVGDELKNNAMPIVSCSALKQKYRRHLRQRASKPVVFLYLRISREEAVRRMNMRVHFMPVCLIDSQFAVLEEPTNEEDIITIEGSRNPDDIESNFISIIGAEV